eukprot:6459896-Amphidinium_carterae.2
MMCEAFVNTSNSGISAKDFLQTYSGLWQLVMPADYVQRVLDASAADGWSSVATEMRAILHSSCLGRKLFSEAATSIVQCDIDAIMERAQAEVRASTYIDADFLRTVKAKHYTSLTDLKHLALVPARHVAKVSYSGLSVPIAVTCHEEHLNYAVAAASKEVAVECGALPALPGELEVRDITVTRRSNRVDAKVFCENKNARACLEKHVKIEKIKQKESIQAQCQDSPTKKFRDMFHLKKLGNIAHDNLLGVVHLGG